MNRESQVQMKKESQVHVLKTDPTVWERVFDGTKKFEIRYNDRDYQVGDILILRKTKYSAEEMQHGKPLSYINRLPVVAYVNYILHGPIYGLEENWVIMSIFTYPYKELKNESS